MNIASRPLDEITALAAEINRKAAHLQRPIVVALDGASGAGKSTVASLLARRLDAALIPLDDFFAADIPDAQWDEFTVQEKRNNVFDWHRLRTQCIEPLLRGKRARWKAFDFESGLRDDGTYGMQDKPKIREPADVIIIDGAYSAGPELADLVDLAILVQVPKKERHARLRARDGFEFSQDWLRRWEPVEEYYFNNLRPRDSFHFILQLHDEP